MGEVVADGFHDSSFVIRTLYFAHRTCYMTEWRTEVNWMGKAIQLILLYMGMIFPGFGR